jgi:hypothetical protein
MRKAFLTDESIPDFPAESDDLSPLGEDRVYENAPGGGCSGARLVFAEERVRELVVPLSAGRGKRMGGRGWKSTVFVGRSGCGYQGERVPDSIEFIICAEPGFPAAGAPDRTAGSSVRAQESRWR